MLEASGQAKAGNFVLHPGRCFQHDTRVDFSLPDFLQTENRWGAETGAHLVMARIAAEKALIAHKLKEKLEALKQRPSDWKLGSLGD